MAASRDRLFNSPRVRAALHLGQVTPLSPPLTQPWGWEKGESCLALRQQQQAAEIKELKIWGNDFKASAKRWHDETTKTIIGISKVCTPLRNIFHLKNFTLMRVLQSSAALLKLLVFSPDSGQTGFCLGSANLGNRAAIEAPGPADTAVEQIRSVCCGCGRVTVCCGQGLYAVHDSQTALRTQQAL